MGKNESIFLGTCINIAKDDMIARGKPIMGNEEELLNNAKTLFEKSKEINFLELAEMR